MLMKHSHFFLSLLAISLLYCDSRKDFTYQSIAASSTNYSHAKARVHPSDSIIAEITEVPNFCQAQQEFTLYKQTKVTINAIGEGISLYFKNSSIPYYSNDAIEIMFDLDNSKSTFFDLKGNDRLYAFVWSLKKIFGYNIATDKLEFQQSDPDENTYIFEFKFPWKTLNYINPKVGKEIGFDVTVADNDGNLRDGLKIWAAPNNEGHRNTSLLGTLILNESSTKPMPESKYAIANFTKKSIRIDGEEDNAYMTSKFNDIKNIIISPIDNNDDLSAGFKALWDKNNLYLLIKVNDDVKNVTSIMYDYAYLQDTLGRIVWTMNMKKTSHAGGAMKNRIVRTDTILSPGKYFLKYKSDKNHAWNSWDDLPPSISFYGVKLIKNE
jgi:hypothetical protein